MNALAFRVNVLCGSGGGGGGGVQGGVLPIMTYISSGTYSNIFFHYFTN